MGDDQTITVHAVFDKAQKCDQVYSTAVRSQSPSLLCGSAFLLAEDISAVFQLSEWRGYHVGKTWPEFKVASKILVQHHCSYLVVNSGDSGLIRYLEFTWSSEDNVDQFSWAQQPPSEHGWTPDWN